MKKYKQTTDIYTEKLHGGKFGAWVKVIVTETQEYKGTLTSEGNTEKEAIDKVRKQLGGTQYGK